MKFFKVLCLAGLALFGANSIAEPNQWCHPDDGPSGAGVIAIYTNGALIRRDVARMRVIMNSTNSNDCPNRDGQPQLSSFARALSEYFEANPGESGLKTVDYFKNTAPKEALSALIEAEYWIDSAWHARGGGYASSVRDDGWKMFRERIAKAEVVLSESKPYASSNPIWYVQMLIVKQAGNAPRQERDAVFVEGAEKFSWYLPLFFTMASYLAPWWGGNWDTLDNMTSWSVVQTKSTMGTAMYARLYWSVSENHTQVSNVFKTTKAKWPKMKQGFDDLTNRFPSMWNLNAYARYACDAGDRLTYINLRKRLGNDGIEEAAWVRAGKHHEVCDAKFRYTG